MQGSAGSRIVEPKARKQTVQQKRGIQMTAEM